MDAPKFERVQTTHKEKIAIKKMRLVTNLITVNCCNSR
jgi:hypothetical protein